MDLFEAVTTRNMAALIEGLQHDPAAAVSANADGASLLSYAAYTGNPDAVAAIRAALPHLTPFEACIVGDEAELKHAIAEGWDANQLAPDGFTPLALCAFFRHPELVDLLLPLTRDVNQRADNAQQVAALHAATAMRDAETVEKLLRAGADPNLPQQQGFLPIHAAAQHGDAVITGLLLLSGAWPTLTNAKGETAIDLARTAGHVWLADRLDALVANLD